jgi:phosphatidylinositol-3-phosphatase
MHTPKPNALHLGAIFSLIVIAAIAAQTVLAQVPTPAHVVVVIEENHGYSQIVGSPYAPYINTLASQGALFTNSFGLTHPSEPNYFGLFSGSTQGVKDDSCPHTFPVASLESALLAAGKSFVGYSEGLPAPGSKVCTLGLYARRHAPWTNFSRDLSADNQPLTSFPADFSSLPTVAFVIPNLNDDMHNGTIQQGDSWLQTNLLPYVTWAQSNNSLLIVLFDEDQGTTANHIATIFVGPIVKPGTYRVKINHYNVLRTIEDIYALPHLGKTATAKSITAVWK